MPAKIKSLAVLAVLAGGIHPVLAGETVIVPGAGPSTVIVQEFFLAFADQPIAEGVTFVVPSRSIKHAGGLKATENNLFGRTGRPLTPGEKGDDLREIPLARIPLTFVLDPAVGLEHIDRDQLVDLLVGRVTNWSEVGGADLPVRLVGREPTEAALMEIMREIPELGRTEFAIVLEKDHQLVAMMQTDDRRGVLGFGAAPNFDPDLHLAVEGFESGLAVGLVHHRRHDGHPLVAAVRAFALEAAWLSRVVEMGYLPISASP